jgi:2-polyprenyl-6-hydroxyphenyl methylase/3-demethylubiquinone-9 3-methyltransferase
MSVQEIPLEKRFRFGKNWLSFLSSLKEEQVDEAQRALEGFLNLSNLTGMTFLDIGSGSGIHSLAARRMGAQVRSFDFDPDAVLCTQELKRRYYPHDESWTIEQGSVLNRSYVQSLGVYDICYSWGVLHHTGALWQALYNAQLAVKPGGLMFIGIYNDEGIKSALWKAVKRTYNAGTGGRWLMTAIFYPLFFLAGLLIDLLKLRNPAWRYREHIKYRGMSLLHDWKDWLGGYPFEPAEPQELIGFFENLGFEIIRFAPTGHGFGNNQFLLRKKAEE